MVGFPVAVLLLSETSQPLAHEVAGCDAGDSSHTEILIDADIFYISINYNTL
jgi:hypothetical protein